MRSRSTVALGMGMLVGGCLGLQNPGCGAPDERPGSIRSGQGAGSREAGAGLGSVTMRVSRVTDQNAGLRNVIVSLHADPDVSNPDEYLRRSATDAAGLVRWDSVPAGRYGVWARAIGYDGLRGRIVVRAGRADTVQVALRGRTLCAAPNSGGVTAAVLAEPVRVAAGHPEIDPDS